METGRPLVLVVDDDPTFRLMISEWLREQYEVAECDSGEACLQLLGERLPAAVLLDLSMPGIGGHKTLERALALNRHLPVLVLTSNTDVETVGTMQRGAYDFLPKPLDKAKLVRSVGNAVERFSLSLRLAQFERQSRPEAFPGVIGASAPMKRLFQEIERVAAADITVFIHGESGSGKELVARAIHGASGRSERPFSALNCAAIPEALQESELFGHERGAFTGASGRHLGRFEQVAGGTLLLDEVAELSLPVQAKLLRVLQERRIHRIGSTQETEVDFRLLAATHRDLAAEVKAGRFREDLYFRIVVYELEVPPLRARTGDVPLLARHFVETLGPKLIGKAPRISEAALALLATHSWPGNVRELENACQRAIVSSNGEEILPRDLPPKVAEQVGLAMAATASAPTPPTGGLWSLLNGGGTLADLERKAIELALLRCNGNRSVVAAQLGIGRSTLYRKLKDYGLE
jgi:two-component system, NtrC family, response regulator HydG